MKRGRLQNKQAKLFGGSKIGDGRTTSPHSVSPSRTVGGSVPHLDRWQGLSVQGSRRGPSLPKATAALCVNRVPWASNNTTLPTALASCSSTPTYAAATPRPSQITQGTRMPPALSIRKTWVCGGGSARGAHARAVRACHLAAAPQPNRRAPTLMDPPALLHRC